MLQIDIVTLFPEMFKDPFECSIIGRAVQKQLLNIKLHQLRDYACDQRGTVDDAPFGGGPGMVLKVEPLFRAVEKISSLYDSSNRPYVIVTSPKGTPFNQQKAEILANKKHIVIVCGRYEGVDERFIEHGADEQISIGPYILTGGELAAAVMVDVWARLIPNVLGNSESVLDESLTIGRQRRFKAPVYTRPAVFRNWKVPEVLLSGNHKQIASWRRKLEKESDSIGYTSR